MTVINDIIADYNNEMIRIQQGKEITRSSEKKHIMNNERRKQCKEKLISGSYTSVQFLQNIIYSLGNATLSEETTFSDSADIYEESEPDRIQTNQCVVCLQPRSSTWLFMPCKHTNCCTYCSDRIKQLK